MTPDVLAWIDRQKPALVGVAEGFLSQHHIFERPEPKDNKLRDNKAKDNKPRVSGSQLRLLLNAAQSGSPVAVLVNLLHYQVGRGSRGWGDQQSGEALAKTLRESVSDLAQTCGASGDDLFEVEARVAALLLGFLIREYTYGCKQAGTMSWRA